MLSYAIFKAINKDTQPKLLMLGFGRILGGLGLQCHTAFQYFLSCPKDELWLRPWFTVKPYQAITLQIHALFLFQMPKKRRSDSLGSPFTDRKNKHEKEGKLIIR